MSHEKEVRLHDVPKKGNFNADPDDLNHLIKEWDMGWDMGGNGI